MTNLTSKIGSYKAEDAIPEKKMVNHLIFLIDMSSSMSYHMATVKKVFDKTLSEFQQMSESDSSTKQQINLSLYKFASDIDRTLYNKNIKYANEEINFHASGMTMFRDCIIKAIDDHKHIKSTETEDHSFLLYAITDGEDNRSKNNVSTLAKHINALDDSWTVAALVPDVSSMHQCKKSGIPSGNIQIWDTRSNKGFEEVGQTIASSYASYSTMRSTGTRSSSNLFQVNTDQLTSKTISSELKEIDGMLFNATGDVVIKEFVERCTGKSYVKGKAYYELSKTETIQSNKEIVIISNKDGKRYGGQNARDLIGLPDYAVKVKAGQFGDWKVYVQSTSVNRKIKDGTSIFVIQ